MSNHLDGLVSVHCPDCGSTDLTEQEDACSLARVVSWQGDQNAQLQPDDYGDSRTEYYGTNRTILCDDCEQEIQPVGVWQNMIPVPRCAQCHQELPDTPRTRIRIKRGRYTRAPRPLFCVSCEDTARRIREHLEVEEHQE